MPIVLTSPIFGAEVGDTVTRTAGEEAWAIAQGYAKNADDADADSVPDDVAYAASFAVDGDNDNSTDYTGALKADGLVHLAAGGDSTDILPSDDPTLASNRGDKAQWPDYEAEFDGFANDGDHLDVDGTEGPYDFDSAGVDNDAPSNLALDPATGPAAGGTVVTITGDNLDDVTGVTFGGTAGTALAVADGTITVTTPAHAPGAVDVVVTDDDGSSTLTGGFTYA